MKKILFIILFVGNLVFGQQFDNIGFENINCDYDCEPVNGQLSCVDGWWSDYTQGVVPLKYANCEPELVCNENNSILLVSTSGFPGSSIRTTNPFFGETLQGSPIISLTVKKLENSTSGGGIRVIGRNSGQNNYDVVGFGSPVNTNVCETINIVLDQSVTNFEELSFSACTSGSGTCHGGIGNSIVVDDIEVVNDVLEVSDQCGVITVAINPNLNLNVTNFIAVVTDDTSIDDQNLTGDPLTLNVGSTGTYPIDVFIEYGINETTQIINYAITHIITDTDPLPISITADGTDITDTLTHFVSCDLNCVTINATNIENAIYNTVDPVSNNSQGLFCNFDGLTSFVVNITGTDSCGQPYSENVTVNIDQDCCPHIEMVRLWDNSYQIPSGASIGNYTDYSGEECIPIFDLSLPQINIIPSKAMQQIALFVDLNGDGDFCDQDEQVTNGLDTGFLGIGVSLQSLIDSGSLTGGETIRAVVSDSPITCNTIPVCGEVEDYVLCDPCPEEMEIIAYCEDPCDLESFPLKVQDQGGNIITILDGASFEWVNFTTGEESNNDIVQAKEFELWQLTLTLENGCIYELEYQFICCDDYIDLVAYECPTEEDVALLESQLYEMRASLSENTFQKNINSINALKGDLRTNVECDPCDTGLFIIRLEDEAGNLITNADSISWSDGLYENQNLRWGFVDTLYTVNVTLPSDNGIDNCTYTDEIIYECDPDCEVTAPTNVQVNGTTISWDPVPGAEGYIVEPAIVLPVDCSCEYPISVPPIHTNDTSVVMPIREANCTIVQVRAICDDDISSPASEIKSVDGRRIDGKEQSNVSVTPNPSRGLINVEVDIEGSSAIELEIYRSNGFLVKTIKKTKMANEILSFGLDLKLPSGLYLLSFKTSKKVIATKRIIIK